MHFESPSNGTESPDPPPLGTDEPDEDILSSVEAPPGVTILKVEASPAALAATPKATEPASTVPIYKLTWFMLLVAFLLVATAIVPYFIQKVSYSWNLGKQKAEYEVASDALKNVKLNELSTLVSKKAGPSVVHINVHGKRSNSRLPFRGRRLSQGQGSGVVVDADGYILTNRHVVEGAIGIDVSLGRGRSVPAKIWGTDELTDIAVLKIDESELIPIEWGSSEDLDPGSMVWALGSPFGLDRSITFGIVSAKHRWLGAGDRPHKDYLQTDAAVNPGNSGGPLVDARGRLVGITTAIVGESYQGISFAVPSDVAKVVFERIREDRKFVRGFLGVQPRSLTEVTAQQVGMPLNEDGKSHNLDGAYVFEVSPDSPAERAGLRVGDVIFSWNDPVVGKRKIVDAAELFNRIGNTRVGTKATVGVFRDGETIDLDVTVGRLQRQRR